MKRTHLNLLIDLLAFAAFAALSTTGILMRYLLPPGSTRSSLLWSLDRHEWGAIHFWISIAFFGILALHILLHWKWIAAMLSNRSAGSGSGLRFGLGVVGLLGVIALASAPLLAPVQPTNVPTIEGQMTLSEVASTTGVPSAYLLETLQLPPDTDTGQRLGQLKRKYGFDIDQVRDAVEKHAEK